MDIQEQLNELKAISISNQALLIAHHNSIAKVFNGLSPTVALDYKLLFKKEYDTTWKQLAVDHPELSKFFDKFLDELLE